MQQKKVSVIIVSYNVADFLELCLDSVFRAIRNIDAEVIVIDNASSDNSLDLLRFQFPETIIIANQNNVGFSKANNQGIEKATGTYLHFLNPDTILAEDFYEKAISFMDTHPKAGSLGPRIIDGKGKYSFDSKKSFPSFWVSVFKVFGLTKIFPKSQRFNKYYAAQVGEHETAAVDVLSGCCMLVRSAALKQCGGGFDERYFMYCEDVDLCCRLNKIGFENYYFPELTIVHYKGESTRKQTLTHMKQFYKAHALFVKTYYPLKYSLVYNAGLKLVLFLRSIFSYFHFLLGVFKLFLMDVVLLTATLLTVARFGFTEFSTGSQIPQKAFYPILFLYVAIWMLSLYFNGAYDKPYSQFKAGRGMLWGIILTLAFYGLLPAGYTFSIGITFFTGISGVILLLLFRWLFAWIGWIKLVPRGKIDYRAVIVGNKPDYAIVKEKLKNSNYLMQIEGRVATSPDDKEGIGYFKPLDAIQQTLRLNEIVFCAQSLSYTHIVQSMEACSPWSFFKIVPAGNRVVVGSNFSKSNSDLFSLTKEYVLGMAPARRTKRVVDILLSIAFIILLPVLLFWVKNKEALVKCIMDVFLAKKTWVGYNREVQDLERLPKISLPIFPPYQLIKNYEPTSNMEIFLAKKYATEYDGLDDIRLVLTNFRFLEMVLNAAVNTTQSQQSD